MTTTSGTSQLTHRQVAVPSNLEKWAFLFMRLSGVMLLVLAVGHVLLQHVARTSGSLYLDVVADIWNSWGWRVYDLLLLIFAISHGFNGLRNVVEDYLHNRKAVRITNILLLIFLIITIVWSAVAILSFDPEAARAAAETLGRGQ